MATAPSDTAYEEDMSPAERIKLDKQRQQEEKAYNKSDMNPDTAPPPKEKPEKEKKLPLLPSEMAKGGKVRSIDGIAQRGKTRARRG